MNKTKIEYLTHTWNPIAMRCSPVSEGCKNCWHLAMAKRLANNPMIDEGVRAAYAGDIPVLNEIELAAPLHRKKPARIGLQFMGDLFHESLHWKYQEMIFEIIDLRPQVQFFILTKRPQIMKEFLECWDCWESGWPQVWLGVSVEDQKTSDERIPILLQTPAAHRWISVEPMLGPIEFTHSEEEGFQHNLLRGFAAEPPVPGLDWVVCGGETGPGARPLHPDWVRSLRDQCQAAGVPFFFKGWGEWLPVGQKPVGDFKPITKADALERFHLWDDGEKNVSMKIGHKHSGHLLDGKEWREFPK